MISAIEKLKNIESESKLYFFYLESVKYLSEDPSSSIQKSSQILEYVVEKLLTHFGVKYYSSDTLSDKIYELRNSVPKNVSSIMNTIRVNRNSKSAHFDNSIEVSHVDSMFILKNTYDLIAYFLKVIHRSNEKFLPFEETCVVKEELVISEILTLPKFYVDNELKFKYYETVNDLLKIEDIHAVFRLFFTTNIDFKAIEESVFKQKKNGELALAIIMLYKNVGLTNSWRSFVLKHGIGQSINILIKAKENKDTIDINRIINLIDTLKSIT